VHCEWTGEQAISVDWTANRELKCVVWSEA
jgi:hypothetical protein